MSKLIVRRQPGSVRSRTARAPLAIVDSMGSEPPSDSGDFAAISRRHEEHLRRVALRLTGSWDAANDLVQGALALALAHFDRFQQGTNARAWLVRILTNQFYDRLKHEAVVARAEQDLMTLAAIEDDPTISRIPDDDLYAAIAKLPPDLRTVIECRYLKQTSYREIAEHLGVPVGTVGTRLKRAHEQLKKLLSAMTTDVPES